jgi:phage gp29-like protein
MGQWAAAAATRQASTDEGVTMATAPKTDKPIRPQMGELAPREDPLKPLQLRSERASSYLNLLQTDDTVLASRGGIENLRVYKELLRDDQVASTWQQRRLALTSCETIVEPGADDAQSKAAADALKLQLDAMNWDDVTDKALFAVFYGWGVAEVIWRPDGEMVSFAAVKVRERGRFRFTRDGGLYLWTLAGQWVEMPERKFWTVSAGSDNHDEPYGIGLAHALYWPVFFKRNDIKFWLTFLERFGQPTAVAKLPKGDLDDQDRVQKAIDTLRLIATEAGVVVPEDTAAGPVISLLEAARSGAADYEAMHDAMNKAISKIVVGQTMTTDDGSSRAQAQVHAGVAQQVMQADSDLLCGSFNAGPVKWWTEYNFPGATPPRVYRHTEPPEDLNARAERDGKIKALGYTPKEDYIIETYGDGWEKAPEPPPMPPAMRGAVPGQPPRPGQEDDASFGESEQAALQALRLQRRADQESLAEAAAMFAEQYESIMGRQVGAILEAAEASEDPEYLRRRLDELLEEGPPVEQTEALTRAGFFARMMGAMRGQRRGA